MYGRSPDAAERDDAVPPAQPVRRRQGVRLLDHASTTARRTACSPCNGILFNHESPRRGETFVTRKITRAVGRDQAPACRTSSTSATSTPSATGATPRDYVEAMWRMLQAGRARRLRRRHRRDALGARVPRVAFGHAGLDWKRARRDRRALLPPGRGRPPARRRVARRSEKLGWKPKVRFPELVRMMVDADRERRQTEEHYV